LGRSWPPEGHFVQMDLYAIGCLSVFAASAGRETVTSGWRCPGPGIRLLEEDLAMSDRTPVPGDADDQRSSEPDLPDDDEFAKMRAVMRAQEKHREGGVDPELEIADADPDLDT
jgi:hypothetical protein